MGNIHRIRILGSVKEPETSYDWTISFLRRNGHYVERYMDNNIVVLKTNHGPISIRISTRESDMNISDIDLLAILYDGSDIRDRLIQIYKEMGYKDICTIWNGSDGESIIYKDTDVQDSRRQRGIGGFNMILKRLTRDSNTSLVHTLPETRCPIFSSC